MQKMALHEGSALLQPPDGTVEARHASYCATVTVHRNTVAATHWS